MFTLAEESLLDDFVKTLHILLIDDFGQNSERVCLDHIVLCLLNVFVETRDHRIEGEFGG